MGEGVGPIAAIERAFGAISTEEEKHAFYGRAHLALATERRLEYLRNDDVAAETQRDELVNIKEQLGKLREDLQRNLLAASGDVRADDSLVAVVTMACTAATSPSDLACSDVPRRAFQAQSLEEERHMLVGKANLARAARARFLVSREDSCSSREEIDAAYNQEFDLCQELDKNIFGVASKEVLAEKETMLEVMKATARFYQCCSVEVRDDPEIAMATLATNQFAFVFASNRLREDKAIMLEAIRIDGQTLRFARGDLQDDKELVMAAVQSNSKALGWASEALKGDFDVVLAALRSQTKADFMSVGYNVLAVAGGGLRTDPRLVLEACRVEGAALAYASPELRQDQDFVVRAMRAAPLEEKEKCYGQAHDDLRQLLSLEKVLGAAASVLALPGDNAPVLSVSLSAAPSAEHGESICCNVTLLSGLTLPGGEMAQPDQTIGELGGALLEEYNKQLEVSPPPERLFLVFGKDSEAVQATPWDWDRPLSQFLGTL